ncbi:MAG: hypothetical protein WC292_00150 [Clostridia bacterium]
MTNSIYIIKAIDKAMNNYPLEYEFSNINHARELFNELKADDRIKDLYMYEYSFITKNYYLMEV